MLAHELKGEPLGSRRGWCRRDRTEDERFEMRRRIAVHDVIVEGPVALDLSLLGHGKALSWVDGGDARDPLSPKIRPAAGDAPPITLPFWAAYRCLGRGSRGALSRSTPRSRRSAPRISEDVPDAVAKRQTGVPVLALCPEIDLSAEVLSQPLEPVSASAAAESTFAGRRGGRGRRLSARREQHFDLRPERPTNWGPGKPFEKVRIVSMDLAE
jgi:hypothetical protein